MADGSHKSATSSAAKILLRGGVVAFPTETVYGLGADAANPAVVRRIFEIKGRPANNPLIVHVPDVEAARRCVVQWPEAAQRLADRFWPGPLTLVLPKSERIVPEVTAGGPTVGVRVPDHPLTLEMLRSFAAAGGVGVAAPSANRSNRVSPTTAQHVRDDLGDTVELILDGGPCGVGIESTVVSLAGPVPTVLRPGGVSAEALREVLGELRVQGGSDRGVAASPGRQSRHYAPRARVVLFGSGQEPMPTPHRAVLWVGSAELREPLVERNRVTMPGQAPRYAEAFYRMLRAVDLQPVDEIWIELPPNAPQWQAVRDRIRRAGGEGDLPDGAPPAHREIP